MRLFILSALILMTTASAFSQTDSSMLYSLWNRSAKPALQQDLWLPESSYNCGHFLMVPMHGAFALKKENWLQDLKAHFSRLADSGYAKLDSSNYLYKIQYCYFASEYLRLCYENDRRDLVPPALEDSLFNTVSDRWLHNAIWHWWHRKAAFATFPSMQKSMAWKLYDKKIKKPTYQKAVVDDDLFTMAVGVDLLRIKMLKGDSIPAVLIEIQGDMYRTFKERGTFQEDGSYQFQAGWWTDHYDYRYASYDKYEEKLHPKPVKGIGEDATHAIRYPLWLNTLKASYAAGSEASQELSNIQHGMALQFRTKVLVMPNGEFPFYRLNNYMDGTNGLYRWNYSGRSNATLPFGNSGTLYLGWWGFLPDPTLKALYKGVAQQLASDQFSIPNFNIDPKANLFPNVKAGDLMSLSTILVGALP